MNFFGIGLPEMTLILVLALLIFGPKKLPEIGRSLGKALRGFQEASKEFENEFKREAERIEKSVNEPMKATLETPAPKALTPAPEDNQIMDAAIADSAETSNSEATPEPVAEPPAEATPEAASSQQG